MLKCVFHKIIAVVIFLSIAFSIAAQKVKEPKAANEEWTKPYQPFRIAGNLYYVGSYDLASYLITTEQGNILINTGLAASANQLKKNIETLGFRLTDIKILLTTQAHYDHLGAMAAIKKITNAIFMVNEGDLAVVKDGGSSDYGLGGHGSTFRPIKPVRLLHDGDTIQLGGMQLMMLHHPGHTKGSNSFLFAVKDERKSYRVLIANMPTIVTKKKFAEITAYTDIANDYAYTLRSMKALSFDIWLASHASQFQLHSKHQPGDVYNPSAFIDQVGYDNTIEDLQKQYDEHLHK